MLGPSRIPVDVSFEHYMAMKSILEHALQDFELTIGYEPKWLTCRLNKSGTQNTEDAFFLGWVENQSLSDIRIGVEQPDPGLFRFMDPVHGDTYETALASPNQIFKQYWEKDRTRGPKTRELKLYLEGGFYNLDSGCETCRQSIAIKVENRYVGTLNSGLSKDPGKALNNKLLEWSQNPNSELVQYLKNEFILGGPDANAANKKPKGAPPRKKRST
jgi:hypothetical protein